jgi:hypothetical protein
MQRPGSYLTFQTKNQYFYYYVERKKIAKLVLLFTLKRANNISGPIYAKKVGAH